MGNLGNSGSLVIRNGSLWSADGPLTGDSVGVVNGRIAAIGSGEEVRAQVPSGTPELDAAGGLVAPGFIDSHIHLGLMAQDAMQCNLAGAATLDECLQRISAFAAQSNAPWIVGGGWAMELFPGGSPTAELLDSVVPDRPALLLNANHHGAWANSRALEAAGITAGTPDPSDGRIERLPDGSPSGMLNEGAVQLVAKVMPAPDTDALAAGLADAERLVFASGITGWQEAALGNYGGVPDFTPAYRRALTAGTLRGRATGAIWLPRDLTPQTVPDFVEHCRAMRDESAAAGFITTTVKVLQDGIIETRTAALLEPYLDAEGGYGLSYFTPELLAAAVPALNAAGFAIHVHALGDRATRDALDAIERVPAEVRAQVRNHIAHLQLVDDLDLPRFAELGVTANVQPLWACGGAVMEQFTLPMLGPERAARQYKIGSLLRSGAAMAMGSDWPVSDFDPWQGIHVAVNRRPPGDTTTPALEPEEAIGLGEGLCAYTRGSARLLGLADHGALAVGAHADLAIANRDPFTGDSADIHLTRTVATIVGGEVVHS